MKKTKIFTNGQSQAVRIPKNCRFTEEEVFIKKDGNVVILIPMKNPWQSLIDSLDEFSEDLEISRDQGHSQKRTKMFA